MRGGVAGSRAGGRPFPPEVHLGAAPNLSGSAGSTALNTAKSLLRFPLPVRSEIRVGTYLFPSVLCASQLPCGALWAIGVGPRFVLARAVPI